MANDKIWIVVYEHRYGNDVWQCDDEEACWRSLANVALEYYLGEVGSDVGYIEMLTAAASGDFKAAVDSYFSQVDGEGYDVMSFAVDDVDSTPGVEELKSRAMQLLADHATDEEEEP